MVSKLNLSFTFVLGNNGKTDNLFRYQNSHYITETTLGWGTLLLYAETLGF